MCWCCCWSLSAWYKVVVDHMHCQILDLLQRPEHATLQDTQSSGSYCTTVKSDIIKIPSCRAVIALVVSRAGASLVRTQPAAVSCRLRPPRIPKGLFSWIRIVLDIPDEHFARIGAFYCQLFESGSGKWACAECHVSSHRVKASQTPCKRAGREIRFQLIKESNHRAAQCASCRCRVCETWTGTSPLSMSMESLPF